MAYVVAATWTAKQDEQERIRGIIEALTGPSRAEKGCLLYQGHRSTEEPTRFFLYEAYVDEAAYQAHTETPHFTELVVEGAIPRLKSRERVFYETLEP
jgi:(4S)-4-hydroxy-5-phosphonooxypentane-2,3-dione isomerase